MTFLAASSESGAVQNGGGLQAAEVLKSNGILQEAGELQEAVTEESPITIAKGLQDTLVGLGVVFCALIFLSFVISLFKHVGKFSKTKAPAAKPAAPAVPAPAAPAPAMAVAAAGPGTMVNAKVQVADEVEGPVAAAILAAVAETCGGDFSVTSIKKSK